LLVLCVFVLLPVAMPLSRSIVDSDRDGHDAERDPFLMF